MRAAGDAEIPPIDEDFLEAIENGHAACRRARRRRRPAGDAAHRLGDHPRRAAVSDHASAATRRRLLMLPIQRIRDDPDSVREGARRKGETAPIDELLAVDAEARSLRTDGRTGARRAACGIGGGAGQAVGRAARIADALKQRIQDGEVRLAELDQRVEALLLEVPNPPHASVPDGGGPADNVVARTWGDRPELRLRPAAALRARRAARHLRLRARREDQRLAVRGAARRRRAAATRADVVHARRRRASTATRRWRRRSWCAARRWSAPRSCPSSRTRRTTPTTGSS